jgi:hypothetical protein
LTQRRFLSIIKRNPLKSVYSRIAGFVAEAPSFPWTFLTRITIFLLLLNDLLASGLYKDSVFPT